MNDFKKIMVAVAFSPYTKGIFQYAAKMALALDTDLVITNIIDKRDVKAINRLVQLGYEVDSHHYVQGMKEERQQILDQLLEDVELDPNRVKTIYKVGNPVQDLLEIGIDEGVDMIIMGLKAQSVLEHVLVGSVAEKAFRQSPITLVSYREESLAVSLKKRLKRK